MHKVAFIVGFMKAASFFCADLGLFVSPELALLGETYSLLCLNKLCRRLQLFGADLQLV